MPVTIVLENPVAHGPQLFSEATVRLPDPGLDLMRPPAGMTKAKWRVRTLTNLPPEVASQLTLRDFNTIIDALEMMMGPADGHA